MFHLPGKNFTFLASFGDKFADRFLPELKELNVYVHNDSWGYDGTHYAQLAMNPNLRDGDLAVAVDNVPYRARRILFCWTAWLAGGGDPAGALYAFTIQNAFAWVLLAILLFRWFPPDSLQNFARWFGILFSFGLCFSLRGSLVDGPSLLLIAGGIALAEIGRPWLSAVVLGVSGLGKETNILAAVAMDPPERLTVREIARFAARGLVVILPLAVWLVYLWQLFGRGDTVGARNFDVPLAGLIGKWRATFSELAEGNSDIGLPNLFVCISLTTQVLFFALRPRWKDRWWRLGAVMSLLTLMIGEAVWEGYPSAAARVLLPMLLAFNLAVPRSWRWGIVLLLGNISILGSQDLLKPPPREDFRVYGPAELTTTETGHMVDVKFQPGWYGTERSRFEYWRWSSGSAGLTFVNPHDFPVEARMEFELRSREPRDATLLSGGTVLWEGAVDNDGQSVELSFTLSPGKTLWRLETSVPAAPAGGTDPRMLAFSLRNFRVILLGRSNSGPQD